MADSFYVAADLVKINDARVADLGVSDINSDSPALGVLPAVVASDGANHRWLKETTGATATARAINAGVDLTASKDTQVNVALKYFDSPIQIDVAFVKGYRGGEDACLARYGARHLRAVMKAVEADLFTQLAAGVDSSMVVKAGGSTIDAQTSAYLVRANDLEVSVVVGNDGDMDLADFVQQNVDDGSGGTFRAFTSSVGGWFGVQYGGKFSVTRIANINEATDSKPLTDDLISSAIELMESGDPNFIFGSRASIFSLQRSRTATRADGADAPRVTDWEGIPVLATPGIGVAEAVVA